MSRGKIVFGSSCYDDDIVITRFVLESDGMFHITIEINGENLRTICVSTDFAIDKKIVNLEVIRGFLEEP